MKCDKVWCCCYCGLYCVKYDRFGDVVLVASFYMLKCDKVGAFVLVVSFLFCEV